MRAIRHFGAFSLAAILYSLLAGTALSRTWYVLVDGSGDAPTIQAAIDSAGASDEIVVAPGRYTWTNQGGSEFGLLFFPRGCGGFTLRSEAGPDVTIIDAEGRNRVAFVQGLNTITIDGFTITGGDAPVSSDYVGGGICVHISKDDVIRNCVFLGNTADFGGGFSTASRCNTRLENCTFIGNYARRYGGGLAIGYSQDIVTITGCTVVGNTTDGYGAGMAALRSRVRVENTVINENTSVARGGGLYVSDAEEASFEGVTFSENGAPEGGAVYAARAASLVLTRSIIGFSGEGGGIVVEPTAAVKLGCSDVFGNAGGDGWPAWVVDLGGNFALDPRFCGLPGSRNFALRADSPCLPGLHPAGAECGLVGARTVGCSSVPSKPVTWGGVKSLYNR